MLALKKSLSVFIGFFVASFFCALFLPAATPVYADGEKYRYLNAEKTRIEASGGSYTKSIFPPQPPGTAKYTFEKFDENDTKVYYHALVYNGMQDGEVCQGYYDIAVNKSDNKGSLVKVSYLEGSDICQATIDASVQKIMNQFSKNFTVEAANAGGGTQQPEARCELESLGWIICPILTISAKIVTGLGNWLNQLLFLDPLTIPTSTDLNTVAPELQARVAAFVVWQNMRNFANVLFLLFFLFAIFSIATSMGLSNYSIKRILPRVIIAALLINLSYYIFAFAIDATNVIGRGMSSLLNVRIPSAPEFGSEAGDLGLYGIAAIAGLTGLAITGTLAAILIPFVIGVVIGLLVLLLMTILREVVVVFLVVLSPLAAVLWILPNTEGMARRYLTFSRTMLLIYPFMMGAIAISNIAAQLILAIGYANQ
ncbi:MAG TPA: hypothetical protein VFZ58_03155 [Candidatus Saccharimonadales bacterium]